MKHTLYQPDVSSNSHEHLLTKFTAGFNKDEAERIEVALRFAEEARDQDALIRPRGIDVAHTLLALKVDAQTLQAALLADPWLRENNKDAVIGSFLVKRSSKWCGG